MSSYNDVIFTAYLSTDGKPKITEIEVLPKDGQASGFVDFSSIKTALEQMAQYVDEWPKGSTAKFYAEWGAAEMDVGIMFDGYGVSGPEWIEPEAM